MLLVKHGPSTIEAARVGEPSLTDPAPTLAPEVSKQTMAAYTAAMKGEPIPGVSANGTDATATAIGNGTAPPRTDQPATALKFETVPDSSGSNGSTVTVEIPSGGGSASNSGTGRAIRTAREIRLCLLPGLSPGPEPHPQRSEPKAVR